ncbi:MAG: tetratricopeptide repeat protein [Desulfobacula sp.]|jgi:TPR repeat protein
MIFRHRLSDTVMTAILLFVISFFVTGCITIPSPKPAPQPEKAMSEDEADTELGLKYLNGSGGVVRDDREALRLFKLAADKGNSHAMNNIGYMYENGRGVSKDPGQAVIWYRKAADKGHVGAQGRLADMYRFGIGIAVDYPQAIIWYTKAAQNGSLNAQYGLAYMYMNGLGVAKNPVESARLYRIAAEKGHRSSQVSLGYQYEYGLGLPKDFTEAARWYRLAADQGDAVGQSNLGLLYSSGSGVEKNPGEAMRWFLLSAKQKYARAQYELGRRYLEGTDGIKINLDEAYIWLYQASRQNYEKAGGLLQKLIQQLRNQGRQPYPVAGDDMTAVNNLLNRLGSTQPTKPAVKTLKVLPDPVAPGKTATVTITYTGISQSQTILEKWMLLYDGNTLLGPFEQNFRITPEKMEHSFDLPIANQAEAGEYVLRVEARTTENSSLHGETRFRISP